MAGKDMSLLIGVGGPKEDGSSPSMMDEAPSDDAAPEMDSKAMTMKAMFSAAKSGDWAKAAEAFKTIMDAVDDDSGSEEEPSDMPMPDEGEQTL